MRLGPLPIHLFVALPVVTFFAVGSLLVVLRAARSGVTSLNGRRITREDHPIRFWSAQLILSVLCIWLWVAVVALVLVLVGLLPQSIVT